MDLVIGATLSWSRDCSSCWAWAGTRKSSSSLLHEVKTLPTATNMIIAINETKIFSNLFIVLFYFFVLLIPNLCKEDFGIFSSTLLLAVFNEVSSLRMLSNKVITLRISSSSKENYFLYFKRVMLNIDFLTTYSREIFKKSNIRYNLALFHYYNDYLLHEQIPRIRVHTATINVVKVIHQI